MTGKEADSVEAVRAGASSANWACCIWQLKLAKCNCMANVFMCWKHNGHLRIPCPGEVEDKEADSVEAVRVRASSASWVCCNWQLKLGKCWADVFVYWKIGGRGEVEDAEADSTEAVRSEACSTSWACCIWQLKLAKCSCMADARTYWNNKGHLRILLHIDVLDVVHGAYFVIVRRVVDLFVVEQR